MPGKMDNSRSSGDAGFDKVLNLVSSIVPANNRDSIKEKFVYNWNANTGKTPVSKRRKKKTSTRLLKGMTLPRIGLAYSDVEHIHYLWLQYMETILTGYLGKELPQVHEPGYDNFSVILMKADYNGAKVKVVRSKCNSVIGKSGIIVMDTKETLKIVQENNEVITLPKNDSVFEIRVHNLVLTIFGKHINTRPAERSVKKVKQFMDLDLSVFY